jgi:hypothetical protein
VKRPSSPSDSRLRELLLERALHGLDEADGAALRELAGNDDETFDAAAAAVVLASAPVPEALPASLAQKILTAIPIQPPHVRSVDAALTDPGPRAGRRGAPRAVGSRPVWIGVAAGLLIASGGWAWGLRQHRNVESTERPVVLPAPSASSAPVALSPLEERSAFLRDAKDVAKVDWHSTKDPAGHGVSGDATWSPSLQQGYLRFSGLAPNDRTKTQFQLWIFDRERDARYPVDGGVFDVTSSGEVVVRVTARLHVDTPTLFAVTIEKPGGVVVSARERIVLTASFTPG